MRQDEARPDSSAPKFPLPQFTKLPSDPATGYPDVNACVKAAGVAFSRWYLTYAAGSAFQNLYTAGMG